MTTTERIGQPATSVSPTCPCALRRATEPAPTQGTSLDISAGSVAPRQGVVGAAPHGGVVPPAPEVTS